MNEITKNTSQNSIELWHWSGSINFCGVYINEIVHWAVGFVK